MNTSIRLLREAILPVMVLSLFAPLALAVPPPSGIALVGSPSGGFALDGDVIANTPANVGDWLLCPPPSAGTGTGVLDKFGVPLNPLTTVHINDPYGNTGTDTVFAGGLKWFDNPTNWTWTTGQCSSKTDINNVMLHISTDAQGHVWAIVAGDRASTSGDSYIDFEFLQNTLIRTANGGFTSAGPHGGRTTNDLLLSLAFTGGGKTADFYAWRWQAAGPSFAYADATAALPTGRVFVALNNAVTPVPYGAFGQTNYDRYAFVEGAVDLTALLGNVDPCLRMSVRTIMIKTKASQSSSATIEDFVDPLQFSLTIGPGAQAGPDQTRCTEGTATAFALQGTATPGIFPISSTLWTVVSGSATIDNPASLSTVAHVSSASATLRFSCTELNGCTVSNDVVLNITPLPGCLITGPATNLCPASAVTFSGPPGLTSYAWTLSGNGAISGSATQRTVTVLTGPNCGSNFSLGLTVAANSCSSTCAADFMVNDTTAPVLTLPSNLVLDCPADTRTNATGVATAVDECGSVTVRYSDSSVPGCGGSATISRTWAATDHCGNVASAVQTIAVRDRVAPVLTLPSNITLECPAEPLPALAGMATALDACSSATVTYSDVITAQCGGSRTIARTWKAIDACGNLAQAVQTIQIVDWTAPRLTIPTDRILECPANLSTAANGTATAIDTCGQATVGYSDSVSNACGGTKIVRRTWTATDDCGNMTNAVQTLTVRDSIAPALTAPANRTLECPADTSTNANGVAVATDGCGTVVLTYNDSVSNRCGSTLILTRTWTAIDQCGNTTNAVQIITVLDPKAPTLLLPPNAVVECPGDFRTNATGVATAQDVCSQASVTWSDVVTTNCGGTRTIARTWTATDSCGNSTNAVQTITVRDITAPQITAPPNVVLECPANTQPTNTGTATAQDGCSQATVTYADYLVLNQCGGTKVITRTWIATDACGNRATAVQTITVRDSIKPTMSIPPDRLLECGASTLPSNTGTATAQDGCSQTTVTYADYLVLTQCGGTKVIFRTWMAADACGNSTNGVQMITVRDTTPPTLQLPSNRTLQCPGDTRTNVTGVATAQDGCGSVSLTYSDTVTNGCGLTRTVFRLWTATDQCGNTTNGLQTISVIDTTKPSLSCPTIQVQCGNEVPAAYADLTAFRAAGGTAIDSCSPTLTFSLISESGLVGRCPGQLTRVYRLTDVCGNVAECTQTITVDDTTPPVMTCLSNATLECGASLDPANTGRPTATDNCSAALVTYGDATVPAQYDLKFYVADPDFGTGPYAPTYLKFAPSNLPCPEEARLTGRALDPLRNAVAYAPAPSGQLDALTSIGNVPMAFGQVVPFEAVIQVSGGVGPEHGTIEFTADWSTYTTSNNRFGYDTNYMVYCAFVDAADPGSIDPNQNARVQSYSATVINPGTIAEKIRGTFRVSGLDSGDRVVVEIWVVLMSVMPDHTGGTVAADLVSAQTGAVPPVEISIGTQTDSLGNLSKIGSLPAPQPQPPLGPLPPQPIVPPGALVNLVNRTWTATDDCGNSTRCVQTITVRDSTAPTIVCPLDQSVLLGNPWTFDQPVATDNCGTVQLRTLDTTTNFISQTTYVATRRWEALDENGNRATCQQNVTIQSAVAPALKIRCVNPTHIELSWIAPSTGCQLYVCDSSFASAWTLVPVTPTVINGMNVVVLPMSVPHKFYRLQKGL